MKQHRLLAMAIVVALASTVAFAQTAPKPCTAIDANQDGVIDRAEAAAYPRLAASFAELDANKDGYLDRNDRQLKMQQQRAGAMFDRMDANKDGVVTRAEYDAFKPMAGRKGRKG